MVNYSFGKGEDDGVETALSMMTLSKSLADFISVNKAVWLNFGKMNSHLYRAQLFEIFEKRRMSTTAITMTYFFATVIKNKSRILKAMETLPSEVKSEEWFYQVKDFYSTATEQYVTKAEKAKKYPVVNIPNTNPGLDIMLFLLMSDISLRTLDNIKDRVTFSQINLAADMQTLAKSGYEKFWNETVKGTKNDDKPEEPRMREEYYKNPASDKYNLVNLDLSQYKPKDKNLGFTREEISLYLTKFNTDLTKLLSESKSV
jgi:hypothetical protein